ncbi:hypothetical protein L3Q82_001628 [Scortum barcoo]|uniref:Uncharacterized protein n=1 Tax=Scortum barcoo TaxID=214431 RepID=A0ACB8W3P8_9TELE|nr:hypothetical protein L3Q82_001628 [Scortum barcoo]
MSHREEASGKTQDTLERLCLSAGLGTPRGPPEELEEVSGVREVWASLLRLLPLRPGPGSREARWMDGWMDGSHRLMIYPYFKVPLLSMLLYVQDMQKIETTAVARDMEINDFRGGPSWCFRFMKRRNLSIRTRTTISQQRPKDYEEKLAIFRTYCTNKINEKKIRPEHITNMDEVPLTFDIPVNRTVEKTGTSAVSICTTGNEKSSFTVVLGCQANGKKLPPMVIFKRKTLPKEKFPVGVIIKANPKGWMDEEKMSEWLREVYVKGPDGFFHKSPSLLICDSMRAHLADTVKAQEEN